MNQEERLLAIFSGEKPDVMPWFADLTYWYRAKLYWSELPGKYVGERGKIRLYRNLGCGSHEEVTGIPGELTYYNVKCVDSVENLKDGTIVYEKEYHTPVGNIVSMSRFIPKSVSTPFVKYPVATKQDLKVLQYLYRSQEFKADYSLQHDRLKRWKGIGFVSSVPPRAPLQMLMATWAGVFNTLRLAMREREEVEETIQIMGEADDQVFDAICESPAPGIYAAENLTSDVISPPMFEKYYVPYYKKRMAQLHAARKYVFMHLDGTLKGLLPLMEKTDADSAQAITPAPVGDIPIGKLREVAGPRIILWGGLPGAYFSCQYSGKNLHEMAMDVIKWHLESRKFIMGVADQVPPDGDIKRVKMVTDIVEKYARYD
jgi:uroporphyrinogen-III decarboxylase